MWTWKSQERGCQCSQPPPPKLLAPNVPGVRRRIGDWGGGHFLGGLVLVGFLLGVLIHFGTILGAYFACVLPRVPIK